MKCLTAQKGTITNGIKLWCDPPKTPESQAKYFLHMPDNYWTAMSEELLQSDCVRREGNDVILLRCSITKGDRRIIPETAEDAADQNKVFVLGEIDGLQVEFSEQNPKPAQFRTAIGPNSYCDWLYESKLINRDNKGNTTGHEEFHFLAVMSSGNRSDSIEANVFFYNEDGSPLKLRAHGPMLTFWGGTLHYEHPAVERSL